MGNTVFFFLVFMLSFSCTGNEPALPNQLDSSVIQKTNVKDAMLLSTGGASAGTGGIFQDANIASMGGAGGVMAMSGGRTMGGTSTGGAFTGGSASGGRITGMGGIAGNASGGAPAPTSGGAPAPTSTACSAVGSGANGSGSYTQYYFGQGTWKENGGYRTACGHFGKEPSGMASDTVENIANPKYFAAIPSNSTKDFDTNHFCGACAQVTGNGGQVIVTVIDACPEDTNKPCKANPTGHLDLSVSAMKAIGYSGSNLYPKNTTWKFVPCPVTGNVMVRIKPENIDQVYIENTILPIKSVSMDGLEGKHLYYGTWQLPGNVVEKTLTVTDSAGRTITIVPKAEMGVNQDTGIQFPKCN